MSDRATERLRLPQAATRRRIHSEMSEVGYLDIGDAKTVAQRLDRLATMVGYDNANFVEVG